MKITGMRTGIIRLPLIKAFRTSRRTLDLLKSVILRVETDEGITGWGEAPPSIGITGDSTDSIKGVIHEYIFPALSGREVCNLEENLHILENCCAGNRNAKAAVDMALHDLFGKLFKIPLFKLLGGYRNRLETDITISINDPEEMACDAMEAVKKGFRILKVKAGRDPSDDIDRIKAVRRAAGKDVIIRLDANQGWNVRQTVRVMKTLEREGVEVELLEQPVPARDLDGLKIVANSIETPVLADESVFSALDAERIISLRAADYLNIKLMKSGGIAGAMKIATLAEIHEVECFMGCMMETRLSITAAAHIAAAKRIITRCDLDSPLLCAEDPVRGGVEIEGPYIHIPEKPGLGIDGIEGVEWD